ncbi:MAG: M20/M25/M40 family metallo-hydrolase [Anaerolineales bacterium]|nr:M20/M25/M40 family metallo-hydrolase [Anaerolineales bacterium]
MYDRPYEILQHLVRLNTTNPPGNEADCIAYVNQLLTKFGFETLILAKDENRPNLVSRLNGRGAAPPLLLYGHVDVVTTKDQDWKIPPFEGRVEDGYLWGRGTLDMKSGVAMMLAALLRAKAEGIKPAGDVVLAIMSDEEGGGAYGAEFMVNEHPEQFEGVRYALGEFGGATLYMQGRKFYPIQVAEKQVCWMKGTIRGPAGHGSRPMRGGAMATLAQMLQSLEKTKLPVHITPVARQMIGSIAQELPFPASLILRQLLKPALTDHVLRLLGSNGAYLETLFHNTVNATIVHGGEKVNVIPSMVEVELDGRLLPGYTPEDMFTELREIMGEDVELEVVLHQQAPTEPDMGMFDTLAGILKELDNEALPIPMLLPAVTDGRFLAKLGIQTYGFTPMNLPEEFKFFDTIHAADERITLEAVDFGAEAMYQAILRYRE